MQLYAIIEKTNWLSNRQKKSASRLVPVQLLSSIMASYIAI